MVAPKMLIKRTALFAVSLVMGFSLPGYSAEFFVNKQGKDGNDGGTKATAFLTIQRGVDALQPGDTLWIGPGEYVEAVKRDGLGSAEKETVIRAEVPGTALLKGDVELDGFQSVPGKPQVYVVDTQKNVQIVNELDTFIVMERKQNVDELMHLPGASYFDAEKGKLYISTSDSQPVDTHRYSASVVDADGLRLTNPVRVTVDGLAARGFNSATALPWDEDYKARRGIFLGNADRSTIRRCIAFMNGGGLLVGNHDKGSGSVIEWSEAYGNFNPFSLETANINAMHPKGVIIRDSVAYRGGGHGIKVYLTSEGPPKVERCVTWGNRAADLFVKGKGDLAEVYNTVAPNKCLAGKLHFCTYGRDNIYQELVPNPKENIHFQEQAEGEFDPDKEFADPENVDYHLQATSKFRGAGPEGKDAGAFQYEANIFYVKADGDDGKDGLAVDSAWKSFDRALEGRKAGDTIYLLEGTYTIGKPLSLGEKDGKAVRILARGRDMVIVQGPVKMVKSSEVHWERINFADTVEIDESREMSFRNCRFLGSGTGLKVTGTDGLKVTHGLFSGFSKAAVELGEGCQNVFLASNLFANDKSVAVAGGKASILYSDYNGYADAGKAWESGGQVLGLKALGEQFQDVYSSKVNVPLEERDGVPQTEDISLATVGWNGKAIGINVDRPRKKIFVSGPNAHSVSDTTANFDWATSGFATCKIAWGKTPECENTRQIETDYAGSFSLTGLEPGTTYYFKLVSVRLVDERGRLVKEALPAVVSSEPLRVETAKKAAAPKTYYVALTGSDRDTGLTQKNAVRTISRAAELANKGDTVLIAPGEYQETVRVRASGDEGAPITFRALGGGQTWLAGNFNSVNRGFRIAAKSDIHVDGIYFKGYVRGTESSISWPVGTGAVFMVSDSENISITRCFHDGRLLGYASRFVTSVRNKNLMVKNSVFIRGFHGMHIEGSEGVTIEHNVMFHNLVFHMTAGAGNENLVIKDNIITDNYIVKRRNALIPVPSQIAWGTVTNNCYFLRVPYLERQNLFGEGLDTTEWAKKTDSLFADPGFPIGSKFAAQVAAGKFVVDQIVNSDEPLDFRDLFATNPEVLKRGMGLIPADFAGFSENVQKP